MNERELNPPEVDEDLPLYFPAQYFGFIKHDFQFDAIVGASSAYFHTEKVRTIDNDLLYCECYVDLKLNQNFVRPLTFKKLSEMRETEFNIIKNGKSIASWSKDYELQCRTGDSHIDDCSDLDGLNHQ